MALSEIVSMCHLVVMLTILAFLTQDFEWERVSMNMVADSSIADVSAWHMAIFRTLAALVIWGALIFITLRRTPLYLTVVKHGKKELVALIHFERYSMFTVWCWTLKVLYVPVFNLTIL